MKTLRRPLRIAALGLACLLIACGHTPAAAPTAKPAAKPAPAAPIDWLPADALAVVHIDVVRMRAAPLPEQADDELTAEQRTVLERTHTVLIAAVPMGEEEQALAAVLVGDYDAQVNPLQLATGARKRMEDPARELWLAGEYVWMRAPEGYWIVGEPSLAQSLFKPPASRPSRLSAQAWTAPTPDPYIASVVLHLTPALREALLDRDETNSVATLMNELDPVLRELQDIRLTALPEGSGLRLVADIDFASEHGAERGERVLRGMIAFLGAMAPEGTSAAPAPGAPQPAVAAGLDDALDAAQISAQGKRLRAMITLDGQQLTTLAESATDDAGTPSAQVAAPEPAYEPPSPELLAERARVARANKTFAKVVDELISLGRPDLELRDGLHPQTGRPGTPYLAVRMHYLDAPTDLTRVREALRGKGLQIVPIARGSHSEAGEIGIYRARDEAAVLVARGTGEAREKGSSQRLAALMRKWQKRAGPQIVIAEQDHLTFELTAGQRTDFEAFAQELSPLCVSAVTEVQEGDTEGEERRRVECSLKQAP